MSKSNNKKNSSNRQTKQNSKPIRCTKLDISKFSVSDLDLENELTKNQFVAFPK